MKLLLENWRKYLIEQYIDWTAISEDDLYDYDYDELIETRDEIEKQKAKLPVYQTHPGEVLLPTINARIEAIEEFAEPEWEEGSLVETGYSGEYAMKLARAYIGSSTQGIELASMVPDTEDLVKEFKRLRGLVQEVLEHAERHDMEQGSPGSDTQQTVIASMGVLINQLVDLPGENVPDMNELVDERKDILSMYSEWLKSFRDLKEYAYNQLHGTNPNANARRTWPVWAGYIDSYHFIKDWAGKV
jgi:hypothetical protein